MGRSLTGILFYGFSLTNPDHEGENPYLEHWDRDWDGCNEAWSELYAPKQPADRSDYRTPEWDRWRSTMELWKKSPQYIEIDWSGSEECESFFVHVPAMAVEVEWSEHKSICEAGKDLTFGTPAAQHWLKLFCEHAGIKYKEPSFHLAASYF